MKEHRKLAAIMFTDIAGYTAIMAKSEQNALGILHRHRDIMKPLISEFNGLWLKEMGDGSLSSFDSVVDAVNCAIEIQKSLKDETEFKLRIGIHIGDVVVEEGDVFGDGVNVASRIEKLAEPGGICVSGRVYEDIRNKPDIEAVFLGEKTLKNVEEPVKVYALRREHIPEPPVKIPDGEHIEKAHKNILSTSIILAITGIVVVVGGYFLYSRFIAREKPITVKEEPVPPTTTPVKEIKLSIAVLPFVNMSADPEQDYFCDGIADAILNSLTHVGTLRVIARSSSFAFRGDAVDIREIGEKLDADWVLEGGVQKSGNQLRITAQLINVSDLSHLISNVYERELTEVFEIQEEIAQSIVDSLRINLLEKEKAVIDKRYTKNTEAYEQYMLARFWFDKATFEGYKKALQCYQKAVEIDPDFALAYAEISLFYSSEWFEWLHINDRDIKAREYAEKALRIDNTLAEAHCAMAQIYAKDWNWTAAGNSYRRAIELNPGNADVHSQYSGYLNMMGRTEEALTYIKRAQELDPLSNGLNSSLAHQYLVLEQYDEAMKQIKKAIDINPDNSNIYVALGRYHVQRGDYEESLKAYKKSEELMGGSYRALEAYYGWIYALSGERDKAEKILHSLIERSKTEDISPELIAHTYLGFGDTDRVFEWLEKGIEKKDWGILNINDLPEYKPIRSDPRYKALMKKMGLPES